MTFPARSRAGLLALFDPLEVAPSTMMHDSFFRQSALVFQIFDDAQLLGKYIMTDVAVTQRRLMLSMGKTNHAFWATVKSYFFRAFFFDTGNDDAAIKKHEHDTTIVNFINVTFIKIKLRTSYPVKPVIAKRKSRFIGEIKNICHQGTKTRRILFCYSFLVSGGEKKIFHKKHKIYN